MLEKGLMNTVNRCVPNDEVLKKVNERIILIKIIAEKRNIIAWQVLRPPNWFTILIEGTIDGRSGRGRNRQEYG